MLGFDTAENETTKIWWQTIMNFARYFDFANFAQVGARGGAGGGARGPRAPRHAAGAARHGPRRHPPGGPRDPVPLKPLPVGNISSVSEVSKRLQHFGGLVLGCIGADVCK